MTTVTAYEAKIDLPRLLRTVERGERIVITRHALSVYDAAYLELARRLMVPWRPWTGPSPMPPQPPAFRC